MGKPWYQRLFSQSNPPTRETARQQAEGGSAEAQFGLGIRYANNFGVAPDYARAAEWYLKAAEQDHPLAQFNLGVMYAKGQGVRQSDTHSATWMGKAARRGDAGAQFHLGMGLVRTTFKGLPADIMESKIEAYKWLHLAAAQGYKDSEKACDSLIQSMSREAVAEANQRAAGFVTTGLPAN